LTQHAVKSPCALLAILTIAAGLRAAELKIPSVDDAPVPGLVQVPAPSATCIAVSDVANVVAVGHKPGTEPHLTVVALDASGQPAAAAPVKVTLPRPAGLTRKNFPLSLVFHPKLPLLYVWQDIDVEKAGTPPDAAAKTFDHLLIYNVSKSPPALVQSLAQGPEFATGNKAGAIALNASADRLYVPNLFADAEKPTTYASIGCFAIGADGLAVSPDKKPGPPALARKVKGDQWCLSGFPCGMSLVPIEKDVVIAVNYLGPVTWDEKNQRAPLSNLMMNTFTTYYIERLAAHPRLPVLYQVTRSYAHVASMEHVDGYPTLAPQRAQIDGAALYGAPVVIDKRNQVAFGGANKVYLVDLDEKGRFKPKRVQTAVDNPTVEGLAYSAKFDRLYVPVEKVTK
jgi:hypothetical protein